MKRFFACFLGALIVLLILAGCDYLLPVGPSTEDPPEDVSIDRDALRDSWQIDVMLQETEGVTVTGPNPVQIGAGRNASFTVEIAPGYKVENVSGGATYADGVISLSDIWFPTTIDISVRPLKEFQLNLSNNSMQGTVTSSADLGAVMEDTQVTLTASPAKGCVFLGYSLGQSQSKGGEIVCANPEYTFAVTDDVSIYTNYYYVGDGQLLIYDSNGGKEPLQYGIFPGTSHYICPHTLANKGQFTREGYALYGYNTAADGSGTYYGTGWNVPMPESGEPITLYAQWLPETPASDFIYSIVSNGSAQKTVAISWYKGKDDVVVIPETIEGHPVTVVKSGTFKNKNFHTLYVPKSVLSIESGAVSNCKSFTSLYLCDNVTTISDSSFQNCDNFSTLYMLACMAPRYTAGRNGNYQIKFQRLITADEPKLVITSGSNSAYGVDSALLEELIGHQYNVVNYGCNASTPAVFYIEVIDHFIKEGDILLHQPESNRYQFGYNEINTTTWQIFEGAFDAFSVVDIRNYIKLFDSFSSFNNSRLQMTPRTYENYARETVNEYGDFIMLKVGTVASTQRTIDDYLAKGGQGSGLLDESMLTADTMNNLNRLFDSIAAKGAKVYISFAAVMKISLRATEQTDASMVLYKQAVVKNAHGTVISNPSTYVMDYKYFYNSIFHLNTEGSQIRTRNLAADLLAQFAKEK